MITPVLPTYARADLEFEKGEGSYLLTASGERYLDFGAGIAVNVLGHANPGLVAALNDQAQKVWHTSNIYRIPGQERLARRLVEATFADTVFFTNSGGEALECAIKMARKYHAASGHPERYELITMEGAFHGRTLATIAAGGQKKYLEGFGPVTPGFPQVPFDDLKALKEAIGPATAGVLIEPIQGEGGIRPLPYGDLRQIREICDEAGILLVLDEVQTGVGRTGKLFAHELASIAPDIMAIAKALGGGFPVGACLATEEAAKGMTAGTHGSTFGGNPLAMAVANAVLDQVLADGFIEHVNELGRTLRQKLARLADEHPDIIEGVRGEGLMLGIKCKVPNTDLVAAARSEHLLVVGAGDNTVRLLPPLNIGDEEVEEAIDKLSKACTALDGRAGEKREGAA
ncbi:acetylornithine/N-succinyldiaminopimelate aminotransferase [Parvibaculum indicum]|uniref:acetylornithine transaminase n=1 Tax=Parvibaculum indicum TaxID=562969 RepID=UPI00141FEE1D|nr:acetylornithine/N-succinyldiaminopimelate aminotransferase [Parvibaculum indicum]